MQYTKPTNETDPDAHYVDANPSIGVEGSIVPAAAIEPTMREIVNAITASGLTPAGDDLTQLAQAVTREATTIKVGGVFRAESIDDARDLAMPNTEMVRDAITNIEANRVTYTASGAPFPTKAALLAATEVYHDGVAYTPTPHDYCIVVADESADAPYTGLQAHYEYSGTQWEYSYSYPGGGIPLLTVIWSATGLAEPGFMDISVDNGLLSRDAFPAVWSIISTLPATQLLDDASWLAEQTAQGACGKFSAGDGATTFRLPMIGKQFIRSTGDGLEIGGWQGDTIRNIHAVSNGVDLNGHTASGAIVRNQFALNMGPPVGTSMGAYQDVFDASNVTPTSAENRPVNIAYTPLLKVYGAIVDDGSVVIADVVQNKAQKDLSNVDMSIVTKSLGGDAAGMFDLPAMASHDTITATVSGWVYRYDSVQFNLRANSVMDDVNPVNHARGVVGANEYYFCTIFVAKGQILTLENGTTTPLAWYITPCEGDA